MRRTQMILLSAVEGMPVLEIAERLNCQEQTVRHDALRDFLSVPFDFCTLISSLPLVTHDTIGFVRQTPQRTCTA